MAAQVYNHNIYWNSLSPSGGVSPNGALLAQIKTDFGSFEAFKSKFTAQGNKNAPRTFLYIDTTTASCQVVS